MNQRFENDEEMLTRGLQALASEMKDLEAPEHVEVKVLESFRARKVVPISTRRWNSGRYWLAAVAAVLLIAMSVVALRWKSTEKPAESFAGSREPETPKAIAPREETPKQVEYQAVAQPPQRYNPKRIRHSRLRSSENAQVASLRPSEIATDFIPLRYMNVANLQEGGQIVRVEVPRSALANFGLPVNMDRYNERVKADVLYGVDGLAHAIRFVK
jgi:hypothetical protein